MFIQSKIRNPRNVVKKVNKIDKTIQKCKLLVNIEHIISNDFSIKFSDDIEEKNISYKMILTKNSNNKYVLIIHRIDDITAILLKIDIKTQSTIIIPNDNYSYKGELSSELKNKISELYTIL